MLVCVLVWLVLLRININHFTFNGLNICNQNYNQISLANLHTDTTTDSYTKCSIITPTTFHKENYAEWKNNVILLLLIYISNCCANCAMSASWPYLISFKIQLLIYFENLFCVYSRWPTYFEKYSLISGIRTYPH